MTVVASRRVLLKGIVGLCSGGMLAACAPPAPPSSPAVPAAPGAATPPASAPAAPTPKPAARTGGTPQSGGTLQIAQRQSSPHLNPYTGPLVAQGITLGPIYEPLVNIDYRPGEDFRLNYPVVPWLAERWEQADSTTYTFHLRRSVKWHDGEPFTANDVAFTYDYVRDPRTAANAAAELTPLASVQAVDPHTLRLTTRRPTATLLQNLAFVQILPKHVVDRGGTFERVAVGTGPFKLQAFKADSQADYVRNADYWRPGEPRMDGVRLFMRMDDSAQQAAFSAKRIDLITMQDKAQTDGFRPAAPDAQFQPYLADITDSLYLKLDAPPFSDLRVRRALHLALDRQALVRQLTDGLGGVDPPVINGAKQGWVIPAEELATLPGYRQPKDQDLAEAKRLLAEAGFPNGFRSTLRFVGTYIGTPQGAEAVAAQLARIGVAFELRPMEQAQFSQAQADGTFEAYYTGLGRFRPEATWRQMLHSSGPLNKFPIRDAELDRLVEAQDSELDPEKRKQHFLGIQRLLLDQLYTIPTFSAGIFAGYQGYVRDYVFNMARQTYPLNWGQLWLEGDKLPGGR